MVSLCVWVFFSSKQSLLAFVTAYLVPAAFLSTRKVTGYGLDGKLKPIGKCSPLKVCKKDKRDFRVERESPATVQGYFLCATLTTVTLTPFFYPSVLRLSFPANKTVA